MSEFADLNCDGLDPSFAVAVQTWLAQRNRRTLPPGERPAAVLLPLMFTRGEWEVLLTRRSPNLRAHRGEICFPGGRCEPTDGDLAFTALREAREELGVPGEQLTLWGPLDDCLTLAGVRITPFLGFIASRAVFKPDPVEVDAVFAEPVRNFLPECVTREELRSDARGQTRQVFFYERPPHLIWGATARILHGWLTALASEGPDAQRVLQILMGGRAGSLDAL